VDGLDGADRRTRRRRGRGGRAARGRGGAQDAPNVAKVFLFERRLDALELPLGVHQSLDRGLPVGPRGGHGRVLPPRGDAFLERLNLPLLVGVEADDDAHGRRLAGENLLLVDAVARGDDGLAGLGGAEDGRLGSGVGAMVVRVSAHGALGGSGPGAKCRVQGAFAAGVEKI